MSLLRCLPLLLALLLIACGPGDATTLTATPEAIQTATETLPPEATPTEAGPGPLPSRTPTEGAPEAPTAEPPTAAPSGDCRAAADITLSDVGQEICVTGVVRKVNKTTEGLFITFEGAKFYWVSYDIPSLDVKAGTCLKMTNAIVALVGQPVMVIHWKDAVIECSTGQDLLRP